MVTVSLKNLKRELTVAKADRAMLIRRGEPTAEIDAKIVEIRAQIDAISATVAEANAAGRFAKDDEVTSGELDVRDSDLMDSISSKSWSVQYPWR